ncbi:50S ribosomal protein L17 [Saprospira sp. CCB-QB6]|uniref:50S ribosomal protein L17 n=1 Tax=Saprospira sp. CCB-QB6 TaxID=3023936 RepID=UPI00234B6E82|nr:50S ribosomal protein L17 [Saprospira sp. CCB-QB6]WCL82796.1 50S ribosomal protein L17 [Saprospira sp. CCB-QB6]
MRHGKKFNHLSRKSGHRKALLRNMAIALITHKRIKTTLPKAKALRKFIEPILTRAKDNTTHSRRVVFSYLQNKDAINELFDQVGPKIAERPGGYVRILKMGFRPSDAADVAIIELVDYNEAADATQEADKKRTRRRRKKKSSETAETVATEETTEEATEEAADNEEEKTEE